MRDAVARIARPMSLISIRGKFGRLVPLSVRCLFAGFLLSFVVATGHWVLVETGNIPRLRGLFVINPDLSGQSVVVELHYRRTGIRPGHPLSHITNYSTIAYGWPIANWGTVFEQSNFGEWQRGVRTVLALDVRSVWPAGTLPDPSYPAETMQTIASKRAAGIAAPFTLCYDAYERYFPIFPLFAHSVGASLFYGLPLYIFFRWREAKHRRGRCDACGYDVSTLPAGTGCPECGVGRTANVTSDALLWSTAVSPPPLPCPMRRCDVP